MLKWEKNKYLKLKNNYILSLSKSFVSVDNKMKHKQYHTEQFQNHRNGDKIDRTS